MAAAEPRLTLLAAGPLPAGWPGKVHALWVGAQGVETPWLLSTDADTRHAPDLLARAHAAAAERRLDAVSLAGFQEVRGAGENLLIPAVFALLDGFLGDWGAAAAGAGPPVANGQFILLRREAWEASGGFESVRTAPIDDVAARRRPARPRLPHRLLPRRGLCGCACTAASARPSAAGGATWARCSAISRPAGAVLAVLLLPPVALAAAALAGRWPEALLLWAAGAAASTLLRSGSGHAPAYGLLYPLDSLLLAAVLLLGVLDRRRRKPVSWKGRKTEV